MEQRRKLLDTPGLVQHIQQATDWAKREIESTQRRARQFEEDPNEEKRREAQQCVRCFYGGPRMAGQALTDANCRLCDETMHFSSTATDHFCPLCAAANRICRRCGCLIDFFTTFRTVQPLKRIHHGYYMSANLEILFVSRGTKHRPIWEVFLATQPDRAPLWTVEGNAWRQLSAAVYAVEHSPFLR